MKDHDYITCRELIDFIAQYLDATLAAPMRYEFERHLKICPSCMAYLEEYKHTIRLGRLAMAPNDEPAQMPEGLVRAIRAARARDG